MNATIFEAKDSITFSEINALVKAVGWGSNHYQTEEKWRHALSMSRYIAYIKENDKLISFGRIVEDGIMCMFYDICVHPDYQGNGIGAALMNHLIDKIKDKEYISIGLFVWEGNEMAVDFYKKLNFEKVFAMQLKKYIKTF